MAVQLEFSDGISQTDDFRAPESVSVPMSTVCRLAPMHATPYMWYAIPSFYRHQKTLSGDCRRLYSQGIERIGHLVQLTPQHALAWLKGDVQKFDVMRSCLLAVDLDFNMRAPGWRNNFRDSIMLRASRPLHFAKTRRTTATVLSLANYQARLFP